jgi:hypothetical protein
MNKIHRFIEHQVAPFLIGVRSFVNLIIPKLGYFLSTDQLYFGVSWWRHMLAWQVWAALPSERDNSRWPKLLYRVDGELVKVYRFDGPDKIDGMSGTYERWRYTGLVDPTRPLFRKPKKEIFRTDTAATLWLINSMRHRTIRPRAILYVCFSSWYDLSVGDDFKASYFGYSKETTQADITENTIRSCPWIVEFWPRGDELDYEISGRAALIAFEDIREACRCFYQVIGDEGPTELNPADDEFRGNTYAELLLMDGGTLTNT